MSDLDLDDLRDELSDFAQPVKEGARSPKEERVIAGFEEIQSFVDKTGRVPQLGDDRDIFERLYAVRLDRLRQLTEYHSVLLPLDRQGLLSNAAPSEAPAESMDDEALLEALKDIRTASPLTELKHVRSQAEIQAAEEIANRTRCEDFSAFKSLFDQVQSELKSGIRQSRVYGVNPSIEKGDFFILGGQLTYVAEKGEEFASPNGQPDARLRVIFSNETESNMLKRSLQRALYKDEAGRRVTNPSAGPLFGDTLDEDDQESGTIYVLRSRSDHPYIAQHRQLIHKIGVTGGDVKTRIINAKNDATYLLAEVEVVAEYKLAGINRTKLEGLFHKIFASALLDITIQDRFGHPVKPREWFLVPLAAIDEAVERIRNGSIARFSYSPEEARFIPQENA